MSNPSILKSLYVQKVNDTAYGVFTNAPIYKDSIIEFCAWIPVSQGTQILLEKNKSALSSRLFKNPDGLDKEREIAAKIAELDLQERLDRGIITQAQFKAILVDVMNPTKMLSIDSHAILLGFGSIYRQSDIPNINWEYDSAKKLYKFYTLTDISPDEELTYFTN